jgi:5-methylcytosine-specific restriction endonuclease McrA
MSEFLDKNSVLVLNSLYQAIGVVSPKKALVALHSSSNEEGYATKSIDIIYAKADDGKYDLENVLSFNAYTFENWLMVDFRDGLDREIHTSRMVVRCPTVIMTSYSKMPMRRFQPTKTLLYEMQKGICGYSGKKMPMKAMSVEHKRPKSKGGGKTFQNLMVVDKEINSKRGNKPLYEVGLKPLFQHNEPKPIPASYAIKGSVHPDWNYFIAK